MNQKKNEKKNMKRLAVETKLNAKRIKRKMKKYEMIGSRDRTQCPKYQQKNEKKIWKDWQ